MLSRNPPDLELKSDSSKFGWGGVNDESGEAINGLWDSDQIMLHIKYIELLAGFYTLKGLVENLRDSYVRLCMDTTVAVSYVNKQGGKISALNDLTHELWLWCIRRKSGLVQNMFNVLQTL